MHDPLTVAFTIVRPWPQRDHMHVINGRRWEFRHHHEHHEPYCTQRNCTGNPFPWWKPRSWGRFWAVAGRRWFWPPLITVWHREPGGHDSGEMCKHYRRWQDGDGTWQTKVLHGWRWHVHHWKIQVHPLQRLRRWALTRCAWCGGRHSKADPVNISHSWDGPRGRWWQGAPGVFHDDCSSVERAHRLCFCPDPLYTHHGGYGTCMLCGKLRAWRQEPDEADRLLAAIPARGRITPEARPAIEAAWAKRRERKEATA